MCFFFFFCRNHFLLFRLSTSWNGKSNCRSALELLENVRNVSLNMFCFRRTAESEFPSYMVKAQIIQSGYWFSYKNWRERLISILGEKKIACNGENTNTFALALVSAEHFNNYKRAVANTHWPNDIRDNSRYGLVVPVMRTVHGEGRTKK